MTKPRKPYLVPVFTALMGFAALSNTLTRQGVHFRAVDVVSLLAAGMCFGAAITTMIFFRRSDD